MVNLSKVVRASQNAYTKLAKKDFNSIYLIKDKGYFIFHNNNGEAVKYGNDIVDVIYDTTNKNLVFTKADESTFTVSSLAFSNAGIVDDAFITTIKTWTDSHSWYVGAWVNFGHQIYKCIQNCTAGTPFSTTYFEKVADQDLIGTCLAIEFALTSSTKYVFLDIDSVFTPSDYVKQTDLNNTPDKDTLGYPTFTTTDEWDTGDIVFYNRKLYKFTAAHTGTWTGSDVEPFDIKSTFEEVEAAQTFDISSYHAINGVLAKYVDLIAALDSNNGGGVPQSLQKSGMSVKFIQSSDNKYVKFFCTADEFSTDVEDWEQAASVVQLEELEDKSVITGSYDATVAVGLADNLRGDTIVDAEFYKRKTGGVQSVGSGIAAIKEIRGKSIVWNQLLKEGYLVDMGLPSGTLWASRNIDISQEDGFAASPFQYDCSFFSWGNVDGHNPISASAFDYNWGNVNSAEPWYDGQPYGETSGNTLTGNIPVGDTYDAARVNAATLWRMPTSSEFKELFDNSKFIDSNGDEIDSSITDKRVNVNGVMGLYLESRINGARLFFSCSGYGNSHSWSNRGLSGHYWSSTWYSACNARNLVFFGGGVYPQRNDSRYGGFAVRPIISKSTLISDGKDGHKFALNANNKNISDLTLMFGAGNEPATVEEFKKMFSLDYYDYNKGDVIPFAGQNLTTTGKNQYNPATGKANLLGGQTYQIGGTYTSATIDGVAVTLDSNNCFTTTKDCVLNIAGGNDTDTIVALYNGENVSFEPYEKHTLPLNPSQWRDKQGNLVFPYDGMHGVGTAYDYAKVDADGYIRKAVRCFGQVDLGSLNWNYITDLAYPYFQVGIYGVQSFAAKEYANIICAKYTTRKASVDFGDEKGISSFSFGGNTYIRVYDNSYTDAAAFKTAMNGVMLYYELAEPIEVELATPIYAKYLVDKDGTEEITPENGATPYTTMANLSILYAMDARGEIKNLPKNYLSKESAENMLNAMVSAGVITSYTMTYDTANARYAFTIVAPTQSNE